jgi:hypothetical protein
MARRLEEPLRLAHELLLRHARMRRHEQLQDRGRAGLVEVRRVTLQRRIERLPVPECRIAGGELPHPRQDE